MPGRGCEKQHTSPRRENSKKSNATKTRNSLLDRVFHHNRKHKLGFDVLGGVVELLVTVVLPAGIAHLADVLLRDEHKLNTK